MLLGYVFTSNCTQQVKAIHWPQFPMPFWAMSITFYAKGESVIAYCIRKYLISVVLCREYVLQFLLVTILKPRSRFPCANFLMRGQWVLKLPLGQDYKNYTINNHSEIKRLGFENWFSFHTNDFNKIF